MVDMITAQVTVLWLTVNSILNGLLISSTEARHIKKRAGGGTMAGEQQVRHHGPAQGWDEVCTHITLALARSPPCVYAAVLHHQQIIRYQICNLHVINI